MADLTSPTVYNVGPVFLDSGHTRIRSILIGAAGLVAGQPYYIDPALGQAIPASAAAAATAQFAGFAGETGGQGQGIDGIEEGFIEGYDLSALPYGTILYLSNNAGNLSTTPGTVTVPVGKVVPVSDGDPGNNGLPSKLLYFRPNMTGNFS